MRLEKQERPRSPFSFHLLASPIPTNPAAPAHKMGKKRTCSAQTEAPHREHGSALPDSRLPAHLCTPGSVWAKGRVFRCPQESRDAAPCAAAAPTAAPAAPPACAEPAPGPLH